MKKLFTLLLIGLAFSHNAFAATAIGRSGINIDDYVISDPGNASGYDGYKVTFIRHENDVLIEIPITHETYTENMLCWGSDTDPTPCPGDPDGQDGILSPLMYWFDNEIFAAGTVQWEGPTITIAEEKMFYVAYWNELYVKPAVDIALGAMNDLTGGDAFNDTQKARALRFIYFSQGIDITTSEIIADEHVYAGTLPVYTTLNLTNLPLQCQQFIYKVDEFGWLYWTQRDTWSDVQ